MKKLFTLLCLLVGLAALSAPAAEKKEPPKPRKKVVAHYMCWFQNRPYRGTVLWEHWSYKLTGTPHDASVVGDQGKRDISSVFYPLIGPYDSNDPDVIEYHVLSAKVAGIDGFIIDWYQPESITDVALKQLAASSGKYDFEFAACYEEKAAFPGYRNPKTREDSVRLATDDFRYILQTYASKKGYFKLDGKPAILMFLGSGEFCGQQAVFNYMELAQIKDSLPAPDWVLVREHMDPVYWKSARGAFEWVGDETYHKWFADTSKEQKTKKKVDYVLLGVSPGFDSSGVGAWGEGHNHPVIPRENGKYYTGQWDRAIQAGPDAIQIITWNDFQEGSVIEPTFEFGFQYLDLTEQMVSRYNGRKSDLSDNDLPFRIFQLRKRAWQRYGGEPGELKDARARIDKAVARLVRGDSAAAREMVDEMGEDFEIKWLAKITADKEYGRYVPTTGKEKDLDEAYKQIRSSFNLAHGKTATASSGDGDAPDPNKLLDETWNSRWSSEYKDDQWVQIDLGKKASFRKIILDWENAYAKAFSIEVSDDAQAWKEVYVNTDSKGGLQTIEIPATEARYVRLHLKERATSWGFSLWEIGIF